MVPAGRDDSNLPDTQEVQFSSQSEHLSQPSQPMGPPQPPHNHRQSSISALLNNPADPSSAGAGQRSMDTTTSQKMIIDDNLVEKILRELVSKTSGLSVEQLEQVNSRVMSVIWDMRNEWNRSKVVFNVQQTYNETIQDIEECQHILSPSQP